MSIPSVLRVLSGTAREKQAAPGAGKILLRMCQQDTSNPKK
ncbi:MAG TPA: hypothetical protein VNE63_03600 [Candidatus Acidoferrales bacterium]|nr:hypothetical protein [Candidatus Acidoferrales bacterium]